MPEHASPIPVMYPKNGSQKDESQLKIMKNLIARPDIDSAGNAKLSNLLDLIIARFARSKPDCGRDIRC